VPGGNPEQPIIEVNGKLHSACRNAAVSGFGRQHGAQADAELAVAVRQTGKFDAEVNYITGGFTWEADYNLVSPEKGDTVDLIGWVTMKNESGKTFRDAKIKLMAGDVNKIQPQNMPRGGFGEDSTDWQC